MNRYHLDLDTNNGEEVWSVTVKGSKALVQALIDRANPIIRDAIQTADREATKPIRRQPVPCPCESKK